MTLPASDRTLIWKPPSIRDSLASSVARPHQLTQPALPSAGRGESGGDRSWSLLVPPEHAHGPQGVPPARSPLALVHREAQLAGTGMLEGPASVRIALGFDDLDRPGHALFWM